MSSAGQRTRRAALYARHGGLCHWCGVLTALVPLADAPEPDLIATVEHIVPLARGGADNEDNLVLACRACNVAKGDMDPESFAAMRADVTAGAVAAAIDEHVRRAVARARYRTPAAGLATLADVWPQQREEAAA